MYRGNLSWNLPCGCLQLSLLVEGQRCSQLQPTVAMMAFQSLCARNSFSATLLWHAQEHLCCYEGCLSGFLSLCQDEDGAEVQLCSTHTLNHRVHSVCQQCHHLHLIVDEYVYITSVHGGVWHCMRVWCTHIDWTCTCLHRRYMLV